MDKFVVLQVNTDVIGSASGTFPMKKDEIAFLQLPFADAPAVLFELSVTGTLQLDLIYLII